MDAAKSFFIQSYFDDLDRKIESLDTLASTGFRGEALTLSLVYIDGLSQGLLWPSTLNGRNYVHALADFADDDQMALVHPLLLSRSFSSLKPGWAKTAAQVVPSIFPGPTYELIDQAAATKALSRLPAEVLKQVKLNLWRGTIAAVAYTAMRNPAVHALGAVIHTFGQTTYQGLPIRALDLPRLQAAAKALALEARKRSDSAGKWFGHDWAGK